jgi:methylmalonyl-CoA mutase N-terminal domain/subunit
MDEALALPSEKAVGIALKTQQLIAFESGVADVVDPLGGSYLIEHLTDVLEKQAQDYINRIDALGGAVAAIEKGFQQREIQESSYKYQKDIESGQRVVIGVNKFASTQPEVTGLQRIDPEQTKKQLARVAEVKRSRDQAKTNAALSNLEKVAKGTDNTMPAVLECVEAYASLGEICGVFRRIFGEQKEYLIF